MGNNENKNNLILLSNLFDLFLDEKSSKNDDELFKEWDLDVDQIVEKNMLLFRQLKTRSKAELCQLRYNRIRDFLQDLKTGLQSNAQKYIALTDEIFSKPKFSDLKPMFRNLTSLTEEDRKSILMDAKLLDLLDEIERELDTNHE